LDVLRTLEHQVLEQVREAGAARFLVLRPDVIPQLQVHDRRRVIFRRHQRQAIGERGDFVLQLRRADRGGRRGGRRRDQQGGGDAGGTRSGSANLHSSI